MSDAVAVVTSPFTGQTQAQQWPGADMWSGTLTLPPLTQYQADEWTSFLMELRGMANCFMLGDPFKPTPRGFVRGIPTANTPNSGVNVVGSPTLATQGWTPNQFALLLPGDYVQVGNRLHRVLDTVNSDGSGLATFQIWPSLREQPANNSTIVLNHPKGLMRLAQNKRTWSVGQSRTTRISIPFIEFR